MCCGKFAMGHMLWAANFAVQTMLLGAVDSRGHGNLWRGLSGTLQNQETVVEIVQEEKEAFCFMLDQGIKYFGDTKEELQKVGVTVVPSAMAFYLYDTLGFPIDSTELMVEEAGMTMDTAGFHNEMKAQKELSSLA